MFRPVRMYKFYLAVPADREEEVSKAIARLGVVQLTSQEGGVVREEVELSHRYERVLDRLNILLSSLSQFIEKDEEGGFGAKLKKLMTPPKEPEQKVVSKEEAKQVIESAEAKVAELTNKVDEINKRVTTLKTIVVYAELFAKYGVPVDIMGDYTHIFIRAGLLPVQNLPLLKDYLKPYNVILNVYEGIRKDYFIVLAGNIEDRDEILNYLSILNFEEIRFPEEFRGDANEVIKKINMEFEELAAKAKELYSEIEAYLEELSSYKRYFKFLNRVYSAISFTKNFAIYRGWVPQDKLDDLTAAVRSVLGEKFVIDYEEPHHEEGVKPPTLLRNPSIFGKFEVLTRKRGFPNYFEFDPTPIYTALFLLMYGMMFGDVGEGVVLILMGLFLSRIKRPVLGLTARAINNLGFMLMSAGVMAIIFGFMYGESFLLHFAEPLWMSPIKSTIEISIAAIIFGLIQLILAVVMNIIIDLKNGEYLEAILSWKGLVGLVYFTVGIYLAINFITGGLTLDVFVREDLLPFTMLEIGLLILVYLKPTIENVLHGEGKPLSMTLVEGLQEFVEMFISYLTNSVSYIRLGAFAIAHGALAEAAIVFSALVGFIPSYILFNLIAIIVEGFAAGIQSIRLLYYEFSTKFYRDEGVPFIPVRL